MANSLALDLGTTRIKLGLLDQRGCFRLLKSVPSPVLEGQGPIRTSDADAYRAKAENMLASSDISKATPLAISTQRSSFVLWDPESGCQRTPLISWQDMRAAEWCGRHQDLAAEVRAATGLPLVPNYAAPKLAALFHAQPELLAMAKRGELLFGTLETYLIWHWTHGSAHVTDVSVAARTLMVDVGNRSWSPRLLDLFGVPRRLMPALREHPETRLETRLGFPISASLGDQGAGALPIFESFPDCAYINAGTGTFIMRRHQQRAPRGFLTALLSRPHTGPPFLLWEGPINAGGRLLQAARLEERWLFATRDPIPDLFAVADEPGLAAPYWREDLAGALSQPARGMETGIRARLAMESILFRVRDVLEGLFPDGSPPRVLISGGLTRRRDFLYGLAALLPMPLYLLEEKEMSPWGAAWIGGGRALHPRFPMRKVATPSTPSYLPEKYTRWRSWMTSLTSNQKPMLPPLT